MTKPNKRKAVRKGRGRPARPPAQRAAREQLKSALEAVQGLKGLDSLADAGPKLQQVYETVTNLAPLIDAVVDDQEALNKEIQGLRGCIQVISSVLGESSNSPDKHNEMLKDLATHLEQST